MLGCKQDISGMVGNKLYSLSVTDIWKENLLLLTSRRGYFEANAQAGWCSPGLEKFLKPGHSND